jgi:hypothetical protein
VVRRPDLGSTESLKHEAISTSNPSPRRGRRDAVAREERRTTPPARGRACHRDIDSSALAPHNAAQADLRRAWQEPGCGVNDVQIARNDAFVWAVPPGVVVHE